MTSPGGKDISERIPRRSAAKRLGRPTLPMQNSRHLLPLRLIACAVLSLPVLLCLPGAGGKDAGTANPARGAGQAGQEPVKYIGPGSCAATSCHGSVKPVADSRILQNEYSTWIVKDKHSRAYQALTGEVGERMARILKLGAKADASPKCLVCHALYTTPEKRGRPFEISEGVSCENCHGPASAWLGPHTTRGWPHEKSLALGMTDTRDAIHRTEKCLECHLGTREKFVDHEMIAAGHPDLYFELDSFSAVMPRHWKVPRESSPGVPAEDAAWTGVRDWSTGQAVQLRAAMERLTWRAKGERSDQKDVWPEYSELSCFACHHALGPAKDSWRQEHGYPAGGRATRRGTLRAL